MASATRFRSFAHWRVDAAYSARPARAEPARYARSHYCAGDYDPGYLGPPRPDWIPGNEADRLDFWSTHTRASATTVKPWSACRQLSEQNVDRSLTSRGVKSGRGANMEWAVCRFYVMCLYCIKDKVRYVSRFGSKARPIACLWTVRTYLCYRASDDYKGCQILPRGWRLLGSGPRNYPLLISGHCFFSFS